MFEEELKIEKQSSYLWPLLLIAALLAVVVGTVVYTILEVERGKKGPTADEAGRLAAAVLEARRPAVARFRVGQVKPKLDDQASEANYRLLEKAGLVKIHKGAKGAAQVTLTPKGEQMLAAIPGTKTSRNPDGSQSYVVPLAERRLLAVSAVTVERPNVARVDFTWQWTPTPLGDLFDATGPAVMAFNQWDRAALIQKYGADLFHAPPEKESLRAQRGESGWALP